MSENVFLFPIINLEHQGLLSAHLHTDTDINLVITRIRQSDALENYITQQ